MTDNAPYAGRGSDNNFLCKISSFRHALLGLRMVVSVPSRFVMLINLLFTRASFSTCHCSSPLDISLDCHRPSVRHALHHHLSLSLSLSLCRSVIIYLSVPQIFLTTDNRYITRVLAAVSIYRVVRNTKTLHCIIGNFVSC